MTAPSVVIADDHVPIRQGIRAALEEGGFRVCAEVADGGAAVEAAVREQPDLCLLDVHMPRSGIWAAGEIVRLVPECAVVMLTVSRNDEDLFDALRAGASGYLLKDTDPARLPHALRGVLAGEAALPRSLVARVLEELREQGRHRRVPLLAARGIRLTSREWEVLELMRDGLTTAQIADRLFISPVTVRRHISSVLAKLDVPDRQAALDLVAVVD
ncbi:MAG TPA: response regulator transcription factor [Solirubrobacteraceae bacterium]|nr:response regulator transcription factor [Solirubrobacteraceae bacterium]